MKLKKLVAICVCLVMLVMPAMPQFFGGIPVFDGASLAEALIQSSHMVKELKQLVEMYNTMKAEFDHLKFQAQYIRNMGRFRAAKTVWREMNAQDWYDKTAPWVRAVNTGVGASAAWERISRNPTRYPNLGELSQVIKDLRTDEVSTILLQDGSAINTIDLVGRIREVGPQRERALDQLEMAIESDDAAMQTEAAQLNKINALLLFLAKSQMDQNRLTANGLEMQLLRMKKERDAAVAELNQQAYAQSHGPGFQAEVFSGISDTMRNFRVR